MSRHISYSEASTLAECEMKHHYRYVDKQPDTKGNALRLGSLMHAGCEAWWEELPTYPAMQAAALEFTDREQDWNQEPYVTASWLLERYQAHYRMLREEYEPLAHEVWLEADLPFSMPGASYKGRLDGLYQHSTGLWLVTRKTMGTWDKLDQALIDPQVSLELWAAREMGMPPIRGVIWDALRTYRWKRDERPTSESFQWVRVDRTDAQIDAGMAWLEAAWLRRVDLAGGRAPIRNISRNCSYCPYREKCWEGLAFPELVIETD